MVCKKNNKMASKTVHRTDKYGAHRCSNMTIASVFKHQNPRSIHGILSPPMCKPDLQVCASQSFAPQPAARRINRQRSLIRSPLPDNAVNTERAE